jgi:hypothetical protein
MERGQVRIQEHAYAAHDRDPRHDVQDANAVTLAAVHGVQAFPTLAPQQSSIK